MKTVGLIGFGAIGRYIVDRWPDVAATHRLTTVLGRAHQLDAMRQACGPDTQVDDDPEALTAHLPDIVIEAAGHGAVAALGPAVLRAGRELYLLSVGATANQGCTAALRAACREGGGRILIPAGALAGFDGLMALRGSGLDEVHYVSRKPPHAWMGTPGADACDLAAITQATTIFEGNARGAARLYPKNANLAAAVALAGRGLDDTHVTLIADPAITDNIGEIRARGALGELLIQVRGEADRANPKTSAIVGASVLSALANRAVAISFV